MAWTDDRWDRGCPGLGAAGPTSLYRGRGHWPPQEGETPPRREAGSPVASLNAHTARQSGDLGAVVWPRAPPRPFLSRPPVIWAQSASKMRSTGRRSPGERLLACGCPDQGADKPASVHATVCAGDSVTASVRQCAVGAWSLAPERRVRPTRDFLGQSRGKKSWTPTS